MSITFFLASDAQVSTTIAAVTPRQVALLRDQLRDEGTRLGIELVPETLVPPATRFEARVCLSALAPLAAIFDHDDAVITVLDDAQFNGRRVWIETADGGASYTLRVSSSLDRDTSVRLANEDGLTVLAALGLAPDASGEIDVAAPGPAERPRR